MAASRINLSFFCFPKRFALEDFVAAARLIRDRYPRIIPAVYSTARWLPTGLGIVRQLARPTLSVELDRVRPVRPVRGTVLRHVTISKLDELRRLDAAGIPVPRWTEIVPETRLDPAEWGPYVVTKPSNGLRGAYVRVRKTAGVRYREAHEFEEGHLGREAPMIAQEFVFTGHMPVSHRVLMFLGRPVVAIRYEGRVQRPLTGRYEFSATGGHSIVATAKGARVSLVFDPDIIDLARRVHAAFPEVPVLGVDVIRDAETGRLYVLECNPSGSTWLLSTRGGKRMEAEFGFDLRSQFGAAEVIAEASADAALRLAK
ncbi:MAG: hypothetical protein IT535_13410 [Bauldia sp.]|nr:hypothetical protein [Bauldia sp.]